MKPVLIAASIAFLTLAVLCQTNAPALPIPTQDGDGDLPMPPDTSGYRCASTGWPDLVARNKSIVIRRDSDSILTVRDAKTDTIIFGMWRSPGFITCFALSPNDEALATGTRDGEVVIWDTRSGGCLDVWTPKLRSIDCLYYVRRYGQDLCAIRTQGGYESQRLPIDPLTNREWNLDKLNLLLDRADGKCQPSEIFVPFEVPPRPLPENPKPLFPDSLLSPGKVVVRVCINTHGAVNTWTVIKEEPTGKGLADAVIKVLPDWRFTPATQQGVPVSVWVMVPFHFNPKKH